MRTCRDCKQMKPLAAFYAHAQCAGGRRPECKACDRAHNNARHARVKHVVNAERKQRYATDPAHRAQQLQSKKEQYQRHREWMTLQVTLRRRGLTLDQYHAWQEKQDFSCAICGDELMSGHDGTHIDHCHNSQKIRGLLCAGCNLGIGHFKERPDALIAAARYVAA